MSKKTVDQTLTKIQNWYSDSVKKYGIDARSVGWGTLEKINIRFNRLLQVIEDRQTPFSINELGVGYGELFKYLINNNYNITQFYGYDISPEMLEKAKEYINHSTVNLFQASSINTIADYAITSGIFNVKFDENKEAWETYIKKVLSNMCEHSVKGFSFNMPTKYVDWEQEDLYYADPLFYFDYCKKNFSKYVSLLHDYPLYEFTIIVKK